jgi:ligand-binding sensor domain-containing protein
MIPIIEVPHRPFTGRRWMVWYLTLVLLATALHASGQQYFFDRFSVSDGLAQSTVYSIVQDRNDHLWIGTQAGVSLFDGVEFRNFSASDGLAENGVRAICETGSGHIWFGHTGGGITRYGKDGFHRIGQLEELTGSDITAMLEDSAGHLWITTAGSGVIEVPDPGVNPASLQYRHFSGRMLSDRVFGCQMDSRGKLYFVADPNVKYLNRDSARFDNLLLNGVPRYYITTSILADSRGNIWFGKYNGGLVPLRSYPWTMPRCST